MASPAHGSGCLVSPTLSAAFTIQSGLGPNPLAGTAVTRLFFKEGSRGRLLGGRVGPKGPEIFSYVLPQGGFFWGLGGQNDDPPPLRGEGSGWVGTQARGPKGHGGPEDPPPRGQ